MAIGRFAMLVLMCVGLCAVNGPQHGAPQAQGLDSGGARTVIEGLAHRASLLQTFEGLVSAKSFCGPGDASASPERALDHASLSMHVLDKSNDRWMTEVRRDDMERGKESHKAHAGAGGPYAQREIGGKAWRVMPQETVPEGIRCLGLEMDVLILDILPERGADDIEVKEAQLDGQPCLRLLYRGKDATGQETFRRYWWVDPARGSALLRFVLSASPVEAGSVQWVTEGADFREVVPGLWIPFRTVETKWVRAEATPDWLWAHRTEYRILSAAVNQPLSQDYFGALTFDSEVSLSPYDPALLDEQEVLASLEGDDPAAAPTRVVVRDLVERLLAEVAEGPGEVEKIGDPPE